MLWVFSLLLPHLFFNYFFNSLTLLDINTMNLYVFKPYYPIPTPVSFHIFLLLLSRLLACVGQMPVRQVSEYLLADLPKGSV